MGPLILFLALLILFLTPLILPLPTDRSQHQMGEIGELSEIFQWRGEVAPGLPSFSAQARKHVGEEMSDVLLYLVRMADRCNIDLGVAAVEKLAQNALRYTPQVARIVAAGRKCGLKEMRAKQVAFILSLLNQPMATKASALKNADSRGCWSSAVSLEKIRHGLQKFSTDRDWDRWHTPRNLLLALVRMNGRVTRGTCRCRQRLLTCTYTSHQITCHWPTPSPIYA